MHHEPMALEDARALAQTAHRGQEDTLGVEYILHVYQQETSEAPHTADVLGLSVTERNELPELQRGEGLWRVGQRAFVVRHLVTDGELELFDTNARMMR